MIGRLLNELLDRWFGPPVGRETDIEKVGSFTVGDYVSISDYDLMGCGRWCKRGYITRIIRYGPDGLWVKLRIEPQNGGWSHEYGLQTAKEVISKVSPLERLAEL
jgi:hypothetical protein